MLKITPENLHKQQQIGKEKWNLIPDMQNINKFLWWSTKAHEV